MGSGERERGRKRERERDTHTHTTTSTTELASYLDISNLSHMYEQPHPTYIPKHRVIQRSRIYQVIQYSIPCRNTGRLVGKGVGSNHREVLHDQIG